MPKRPNEQDRSENVSTENPGGSLTDPSPKDKAPNPVSANAARRIVRNAMKATMASLDKTSAAPYASLVAVATLPIGTPILAMSSLSHHHANISADPRVSLLFDGTPQTGDALEGGRVSISGSLKLTTDETARRRFMARHPDAYYTKFADFGFFTLNIDRVHFIAGFGSVRWFKSGDFLIGEELVGPEKDAISQINREFGGDVTNLAERELENFIGSLRLAEDENWHVCGLDAEGADLIANGRALRLDFPNKIKSNSEASEQIGLMIKNTLPSNK